MQWDRNTQILKTTGLLFKYCCKIDLRMRNRLVQDMQDSDKSTSKTDKKVSKPSPIFVAGIVNLIPYMTR